jgi:dihydrofolate reductase
MNNKLGLIVAMDSENGIGFRNSLPWRLKGDLAHFKDVTMGNVVIMGRNTRESLPKALEGRINIVVTNRPITFNDDEEVYVARSIEEAITLAQSFNREYIYLIGGASIYEKALPLVEVAHVTQVFLKSYIDVSVDGLVFPEETWDAVVTPMPLSYSEADGKMITPTHQYIKFTRKQEVK